MAKAVARTASRKRYDEEAYHFVVEALHFTQQRLSQAATQKRRRRVRSHLGPGTLHRLPGIRQQGVRHAGRHRPSQLGHEDDR